MATDYVGLNSADIREGRREAAAMGGLTNSMSGETSNAPVFSPTMTLDQASAEGDLMAESGNDMNTTNIGGSIAEGAGSLALGFGLGGPVGGAISLIGLVGKGILAYQASKDKEREEKKAQQRYDAALLENKRRYEINRDMDMKKYMLTLDEWKENKSRNKENMRNFYDQQNINRANAQTNRLMQIANSNNKLLQVYGRG